MRHRHGEEEPWPRGANTRKSKQQVIAIKLDLKFEGFEYQKWGGKQRAQTP